MHQDTTRTACSSEGPDQDSTWGLTATQERLRNQNGGGEAAALGAACTSRAGGATGYASVHCRAKEERRPWGHVKSCQEEQGLNGKRLRGEDGWRRGSCAASGEDARRPAPASARPAFHGPPSPSSTCFPNPGGPVPAATSPVPYNL